MADATRQSLDVREFRARVVMIATPDVSDELLEEITMEIENALAERAADITPGASASANFAEHTIELDLFVEATSPDDLHQRIGAAVTVALEATNSLEQERSGGLRLASEELLACV